jgi:proliferating cell nuclear antigen
MLEIKVKSDILKEMVEVVSTLVDEAKFVIGKEGITVKTVDPAHVAMVELTLNKSAMDDYKVDEYELGVDLDKIKEVLKLARSGETIGLRVDEEKNRLVLSVGNVTRWMALIDTSSMADPKVPSLNLPVKLTIKTDDLRLGIRASESVADHILLHSTPDGFEMKSEGDADVMEIHLGKDLLETLECKEAVKSLFPLDYFSNMIKSISTADKVELYLGNDYPLRLEFEIAGGNGQVKYLLAPRVETE